MSGTKFPHETGHTDQQGSVLDSIYSSDSSLPMGGFEVCFQIRLKDSVAGPNLLLHTLNNIIALLMHGTLWRLIRLDKITLDKITLKPNQNDCLKS